MMSVTTPAAGRGLFIDGFAGGGGASTGIAQAIGREVDIAINHNPIAIAIHAANHPSTEHHCQDIRALWPCIATRGRPVAGAWFSPDCKEFSKAKGGPVKDRSIRALCWEVVWWVEETQPEVGYLENVEEFEYAAPLDGNGIPLPDKKGREFKKFVKMLRARGYRVAWRILKACDFGTPTSRKRLYMVFRRDGQKIVWPKRTHAPANDNQVLNGKLLPYRTAAECIDWNIPCPSIFDRDKALAEATNRRLAHGLMRHVIEAAKRGKAFIVPGSDTRAAHITKYRPGSAGSDMAHPLPTVTANGVPARPAGAVPLGVVEAQLAPIITYGQHGGDSRPIDEPHHTIAASRKDQNCVAVAHLEKFSQNSRGRPASEPLDTAMAGAARHSVVRTSLVEAPFIDRQFGKSLPTAANEPLGATTAHGGGKSAQVSAFLSRFYGSDKTGAGGDVEQPLGVVRAGGQHHAVVCAHIEQANGGPRNTNSAGRPASRPLSTAKTSGSQQRIVETTMVEDGDLPPEMMKRATMVAAFLVKYYGEGGQSQAVDAPIDVITTKARYAVVTVTIDAVTYIIVDIGLRMLKPRELARAQGFPDSYILNPIVRKMIRGKWVDRPLTIAEQISAIGNSVCPPVARALVAANQPYLAEVRMAA